MPVLRPAAVLRCLLAAAILHAATARAETVWSRWSGAWEVVLDRQPDGATCLWSTYDAPPPNHVRRLSFAGNRRGEVVVIVSDRQEPLHHIATRRGPAALLTLGGRQYAIEMGAGIPLPGLPGGMLVGRLTGETVEGFARRFGQQEGGEARLLLPGGWSWRLPLRGAAEAAKDVTSCLAEAADQGGGR